MLHDIISYLGHLLHILGDHILIKLLVACLLTLFTFFFGELHTQAIMAVVMLMIFDFWTGIIASRQEGRPITPRVAMRSVLKSGVYMLTISAAFFLDSTIPLTFAETTVIGFVAVTEFISIMENTGRMGFATPKKLLNQLRANV